MKIVVAIEQLQKFVDKLEGGRGGSDSPLPLDACRGYKQITATRNISETSAQIVRLIKNATNKFDE